MMSGLSRPAAITVLDVGKTTAKLMAITPGPRCPQVRRVLVDLRGRRLGGRQ
jgi:hypothetical protein